MYLNMIAKFKSTKAFLAMACALVGGHEISAQTPSLGINFAATDPDEATSSLAPSEVAGVIPAGNWNNLSGASGEATGTLVYDANGNPTASSASVTWSSPNT